MNFFLERRHGEVQECQYLRNVLRYKYQPYCCQTTNTEGLRLRTMLDPNGDRRVGLTRV
jgi:hypothetical protein